jgi:hypothetical protein
MISLLLAAGLAGLLLVSSSTRANARNNTAAQFVIVSDRVVGGVRMLATLDDATAVLGAPDRTRRLNNYECRAGWRGMSLTLRFLDLSTADPCHQGGLVTATATSAKWRTAKGLRIGDSVARLRSLYRAATFHRASYRGWWLITRRTCPTTGSQPYPGLLARTINRRVSVFVVGVAACE